MAIAARQRRAVANITYVPQDHEPVLAEELIEHAGLGEGPVVVVGSDDWFEIWSPKRWETYEKEMDAEVSDVAENLSEEGGA